MKELIKRKVQVQILSISFENKMGLIKMGLINLVKR